MYVRRSQLGEDVPAPVPAPATFTRTLAPSSQADRMNADYAAILARSPLPQVGVRYLWGGPSSAAPTVSADDAARQRAQAAAAAKTYTQSLAPVRATAISFYDEARRTKVEQLQPQSNGVVNQPTHDVYSVEGESLPHANDFTPYESVSHGDRANVSVSVSPETKPPVAVSLIPLAIAAWLILGV